MCCLPKVYNENGSVWASYLGTDEKYDSKSGKPNKKWAQVGLVTCDRISFFGMSIKTLVSLEKIRVGRETGNTHIFSLALYTMIKLNILRQGQTGVRILIQS